MVASFRPFAFQAQLTFRVAAAVLLLALVAVLVWGTHWQRAPTDPFRVPGFFAWLSVLCHTRPTEKCPSFPWEAA